MNLDKLQESLRIHEGLKLKPYTDTEGHLTIGFGHNLDNGITIKQAYALLADDIDTAKKELDRYLPGLMGHDDARQNVLIEMVFNMGMPRLSGFKKMLAALDSRDYAQAAKEMEDSKWAKQVGARAQTLAKQMREGWK